MYDPPIDETGHKGTWEDLEDEIVPDDERQTPICPSCAGANILIQGRCVVCTDCGWSSCEL